MTPSTRPSAKVLASACVVFCAQKSSSQPDVSRWISHWYRIWRANSRPLRRRLIVTSCGKNVVEGYRDASSNLPSRSPQHQLHILGSLLYYTRPPQAPSHPPTPSLPGQALFPWDAPPPVLPTVHPPV